MNKTNIITLKSLDTDKFVSSWDIPSVSLAHCPQQTPHPSQASCSPCPSVLPLELQPITEDHHFHHGQTNEPQFTNATKYPLPLLVFIHFFLSLPQIKDNAHIYLNWISLSAFFFFSTFWWMFIEYLLYVSCWPGLKLS